MSPTLTRGAALHWLRQASSTSGRTLHLALLLLTLCHDRGASSVMLTRRMLQAGHVSRDAAYGGLRRLQELGLINVRRLPGRSPQVVLLEPGSDRHLRLQ